MAIVNDLKIDIEVQHKKEEDEANKIVLAEVKLLTSKVSLLLSVIGIILIVASIFVVIYRSFSLEVSLFLMGISAMLLSTLLDYAIKREIKKRSKQ